MISQSGTFYKIIVTSCVLLGVNQLSLSNASPVSNAAVSPTSISHASFNLQYPPSAPTGTGLFFTAGDIAAAESSSFFRDGALASHPLHGIVPGGMGLLNIGSGGNQFLRAMVAPQETQGDDLLTAGQSYFIEPPAPTTTTQKPTFKKRKTRRPISSLAEKSKKAKAAEIENSANNEVFQGNPVPFNPFRQIVNTSFGRKRPSDNRQERPRSRPNAVKPETGSAVGANNAPKNIDSLNEIPKTEGEPRALGRRRPAQDVRPLRPTTTVAGEDTNTNEPPKGRRFPLRKPRPSFDAPTASLDDTSDNTDQKPLRPRNFVKRPRPRPTTTVVVPTTETDIPTETTDPFTVSRPLSTQPVPVLDGRPKVRPARPLGVSRFVNANRNTVTITPNASDLGDESPVPSLPPSPSPRRRVLRPTTRQQSLTTSTEAPEDILGNLVGDVSPAPGRGRNNDGALKPIREGRQGFLLRPRPTPTVDATNTTDGQGSQNEVGIRRPLSNRRRKRPTTTIASPASPVISYNQEFTGGVVESNVETSSGPARERAIPGRRAPQALRNRPTPLPLIPATGGPPAYQIREEQPVPRPVDQSENLGNPTGRFLFQNHGNPTQVSGPSLLRRPINPAQPSAVAPPSQQGFNSNAGFIDPNNFVNPNSNLFRIPSQESFFAGGIDNVLGVPSNFRTIQQTPGASEFRARSTSTSNEPEISHSDFSPAASTEKQSVSSSNSNAEIADSPVTTDVAVQENKPETEEENKTPSPAKLSPLERLQQNRQAAARRLLAPRKPTEKTTLAPATANQKIGKNFRKSIIPPRMLRPRGKLPGATPPVQQQELVVPDDGRENDSGAVEEKPSSDNNAGSGIVAEIINESTSSAAETDKESNTIPISPNPKEEEKATTSTRKPSLLEAAKRRRVSSVLSKNAVVPQQQIQKSKITPPPPQPTQSPEASSPICEDGQRYSKFLKRCVTMYKPKAQG